MTDLSNVVRMLIHQLDATRSYLLPSYCDEDEKARAVIAFAESALAAEPAFAASEPSDEDLADLAEVFNGDPLPAMRRALELWGRPTIAALAAEPPAPDPREALAARPLLEQVARMGDRIGYHTVGEITAISNRAAAWLAENPPGQPVAIEPRGCPTPGACSCVEPPAPAPAADGEREELAMWLERDARDMIELACEMEESRQRYKTYNKAIRLNRAAALLREPAPAPVPVPVAERPWERPGWCDTEGRCWIGTPETEYPLGDTGDYDLIDASWSLDLPPSDPALQRMQRVVSHPHWAIPTPQPPQGGEVEA